MKRLWGRAGPWLTLVLVLVEVVLVWTSVLTLLDAVIIIVVVELLIAVTALSRGYSAVRAFRSGRAGGRDGWTAAEDALARMLPPTVAKVLLIEAHMWVCLVRWLGRRRPVGTTFGYGAALRPLLLIVLWMVIMEGIVVEAVLVAVLGHTSPWVWIALGLHVYGLIWIGGFLGSLRVLPHELDEQSLRLRDSVFAVYTVPLMGIASVVRRTRTRTGRSGFVVEDGAAVLAYGDTTVRVVLTPAAVISAGSEPVKDPVRTIDLTVDEPEVFVTALSTALPTIELTTER